MEHSLETVRVPLAELKPWPRNARQGDIGAIADSLRRHGQYRQLVVRRETGEVLAGNHTLAAAAQLGWSEIAVSYVEHLTDEQAARLVLVDNRLNDVASYDEPLLAELLAELAPHGLEGTGFDQDDLDKLIRDLSKEAGSAEPGEAQVITCPACSFCWEVGGGAS